ncbi:hypothetical protein C0Q70_10280 [Pomacea canaliculata]|uniref:Neurotransmitter-gated ion-channel ligand-binding domain-containing protein n=1 Tax=Pomacea canaliculata TaxID=400727 RepID=A0A2T7PC58_POMCA|nr:neuronal acetylcholine receptor subunit beta-3-like [Pomacea canaliculata]PVD31004.1 hypothetical protein C0Q70_10280 [Pomacea canaliculata]
MRGPRQTFPTNDGLRVLLPHVHQRVQHAAQKLTSTAWLMVTWHDDYLTWDPKSFGGVERIFADPAQVWRPRLAIRNTMMDIRQLGNDYVVLQVDHHGRVTWYPAERFETYCQVIVTYFPLDVQTCTWDIDSWDADGVDLQAIKLDIDHSFYGNNGAWELVSSNVSKGNNKLVFQVTLKRRPGLLILNLILPVMLLGVVNIFVFTVPPESEEKLSFAITTLLSFGVFLSYILDLLPSSAETMSTMTIAMNGQFILSSLFVLLTILVLRLHLRDDNKHPVPKSLQSIIVKLEFIFRLGPPSTKVVPVVEVSTLPGQEDEQTTTKEVERFMKKAARKMVFDNHELMTWKRVSCSLDKILFRFFLLAVAISSTAAWIYVYLG